eukprot:CAMPEP_0182533378 /NCGR_PEP_ID=MMETSP1323-20130603/13645_1 /TAXON_ID=236787 /ORGANISM="Florenciella parvula, Strain RCC1693" /LENGTH=190 /DNA_ID=CAMNT_0024743249 /DNA_START=855 /DNA_END=1427 /DNA_ORIENTATION=-
MPSFGSFVVRHRQTRHAVLEFALGPTGTVPSDPPLRVVELNLMQDLLLELLRRQRNALKVELTTIDHGAARLVLGKVKVAQVFVLERLAHVITLDRVELQKVRKKVTCRGHRFGVESHERYGGAICDLGAAKVANSLIAHPADEGLRGLAQVLADQRQLVLRVRPREDGPPTDQLCENAPDAPHVQCFGI